MVCASLAFIDGLGGPEMILIFVVVLVLFGGQKLPEFARGMGKSIREFKKAAAGVEEEFKRALEEDERKQATARLAAPAAAATPASTIDPAGPEAVHSPATDDSGHGSFDSEPYDDGYPGPDDAPADDAHSTAEDQTSPSSETLPDDIAPLADQVPGPPESSDTPAPEPKANPPASVTPAPKSAPPPAPGALENPS